jgi:VCBS repeat-containing protein
VVSAFDNIDPFAIAGANKAFMLSHTLTVTDSELNLEFLHGIENPAIKGIEILAVGDETANTPPITSGIADVMVTEGAANTVIGLFAAFEDAETADSGLTYTVASNTNPALFDAVSINNSTGELTLDYAPTGTGTAEITVRAADPDREFVDAPFTVTVDDNAIVGKATLEVTVNSNNVQISNFGSNSFLINNTGDKDIAQVSIDVTDAFYPDTVFDPFGLAGDTVSKALTINTDGGTGVVTPDSSSYIGVGGAAGFEGIQLLFDESVNGGFNPGETIGFSVDMDPNSVAGTNKADLDGGSSPSWDVGGVSGAELIGSTFTVTFTDGTTATGQLQGANNQGGSKGLASQDSPNQAVSLTVNGLGEGGIGTYNSGGPSVIINGPASQTARVVLTKGFIQPVDPYAQFLEDQLNTLAATNFPANNAVEFQTVDVVLTGGNQDISGNFDFSGVANYNFSADPALPFSLDEDKLPFGFVASVIDPANNNLPIGPVTQPIYLEFAAADGGSNTPPIAVDDSVSTDENSVFTGNVLVDNGNGTDSDLDGDPLTITAVNGNAGNVGIEIALASGALLTLNGNGTFSYNPNDQFEALTAGETAAESFTYTIGDGNDGFDTATTTVTITGVDETPGGTPIRMEAESADTIVNYRNEKIGVASGGLVLSFVGASGGETGSATFVFGDDLDELTGSYDIVVGTFDENDGLASFTVEINDVETSTTTEIGSFILDNDLGSNLANSQTFVSPTVAFGISLTAGDAITVKGFENASEHARLDYVELVPTV